MACIAVNEKGLCELAGVPCFTRFFQERCRTRLAMAYGNGVDDADKSRKEHATQTTDIPIQRRRRGPISPSFLDEEWHA